MFSSLTPVFLPVQGAVRFPEPHELAFALVPAGTFVLPCGRKPVISLCSPGDDFLLRPGLSLCPLIVDAKVSREVKMVDGIMVPIIAVGVLAVIWTVVLYGSSFFGPR